MSKKQEETQEAAPAPSGKRKKLLVIGLVVGLVLLIAAGAAAYLLLHKPAEDEGDVFDEEVAAKSHGKKDKEKDMPSVFMPLEAITVNLAQSQTNPADVYLQTQITLEYSDPAVENSLKTRLPLLKHAYVMRLASKNADELRNAEGKKQLADELRGDVNGILDADKAAIKAGMKGRVKDVLFTTFLLQ